MASRKIGQAFISVTAQLAKGTTNKIAAQLQRSFSRIGNSAGQTLGQRMATRLRSALAKAGDDAGKRFLGVFSRKVALNIGAFSTQIGARAGNAIVLAIIAAIIASTPIIGAAINTAIILGISGGVIAAGIAAAFRSKKVQKAWGILAAGGQRVFKEFGKPFQGPVLRALSAFNRSLARMRPTILRIAKAAAPLLDRLTPAFVGFFENLLPGIETLVNNSAPFIEALADALPQIGTALSELFIAISSNEGTLVFFQDFLRFTIGLIKFLAASLFLLGEKYLELRHNIIETVKGIKIAWHGLQSAWNATVGAIGTAIKAVGNSFKDVAGLIVRNWNRVTANVREVAGLVVGFFLRMRDGIGAAWRQVFAIVTSFIARVVAALTGFVRTFASLPNRIVAALGNLGGLLYNAGRNIIQGLIDGIGSMIGRVQDAISRVTRTIRDHLPFSPAKRGPLSGRGNPLRAGRSIARMLAEGLERERGKVDRAVDRVLPARFRAPGRTTGGRGSSTEDLLRELIEAVRGVAPGVGSALSGATYATALSSRGL